MHDWNQIFIGIQLFIIFQLTLVGLLNVFAKSPKNIFLGAYCLLLSHSPLLLIFPDYLKENVLLHVFVWAWKGFFFGPVLYLYLMALNKKWDIKKELGHLVVPFLLYLMVLYGEFFAVQQSSERIVINNIKYYSYWLLIVVYFILGIKEFRRHITIHLKEESKVRFFSFYLIVNIHLLSTILPGVIFALSKHSDIALVVSLNQSIALPYYRYFAIPMYLILFVFLTFYGITELKWIKRYFLKASIHLSNPIENGKVGPILTDYFEVHEIFKNPNLTIDEISIMTRLTKSAIRNYLAENSYESFTDYVNRYRVEDLKKNLLSGHYEKYDFASMALISGFNSKATFYRTFKKYTGKTPQEYKSDFLQNSLDASSSVSL